MKKLIKLMVMWVLVVVVVYAGAPPMTKEVINYGNIPSSSTVTRTYNVQTWGNKIEVRERTQLDEDYDVAVNSALGGGKKKPTEVKEGDPKDPATLIGVPLKINKPAEEKKPGMLDIFKSVSNAGF